MKGSRTSRALAPLKKLAEARRLPLTHAVRFRGPDGEAAGVLEASGGRVRLAGAAGTAFDVELPSIEKADFPRLRGGVIELRVGGEEYRIELGGFIPGGLDVGATDNPIGLSEEAEAYAEAAGAGDLASDLDFGLFLVEGALKLFGTGTRGDWKQVLEGLVAAEEIAEKRIDEIIEEEEIFAAEGL